MDSPSCLTDSAAVLVADASAVINLNASGCAADIVRALPHRLAVVHPVPRELALGRSRGRRDDELLAELIGAGLINLAALDEDAELHFEQLVIGPAALTLDDGEAATIAYAVSYLATAVIDERKATRICTARFPALRTANTVDIFSHEAVQRGLGSARLGDAIFNALHRGRMRVFPHHVAWVLHMIGTERASLCPSLPKSARM